MFKDFKMIKSSKKFLLKRLLNIELDGCSEWFLNILLETLLNMFDKKDETLRP